MWGKTKGREKPDYAAISRLERALGFEQSTPPTRIRYRPLGGDGESYDSLRYADGTRVIVRRVGDTP